MVIYKYINKSTALLALSAGLFVGAEGPASATPPTCSVGTNLCKIGDGCLFESWRCIEGRKCVQTISIPIEGHQALTNISQSARKIATFLSTAEYGDLL